MTVTKKEDSGSLCSIGHRRYEKYKLGRVMSFEESIAFAAWREGFYQLCRVGSNWKVYPDGGITERYRAYRDSQMARSQAEEKENEKTPE